MEKFKEGRAIMHLLYISAMTLELKEGTVVDFVI